MNFLKNIPNHLDKITILENRTKRLSNSGRCFCVDNLKKIGTVQSVGSKVPPTRRDVRCYHQKLLQMMGSGRSRSIQFLDSEVRSELRTVENKFVLSKPKVASVDGLGPESIPFVAVDQVMQFSCSVLSIVCVCVFPENRPLTLLLFVGCNWVACFIARVSK